MKALKPFYNIMYYTLFWLAQVAFRLTYRIRVIGRENLRGLHKFVLAPNHASAIDPVFIILARGLSKKMLIMGKEELFEKNKILNFWWNCFGVFPIERGAGDRTTVELAMQEVQKGRGLLIFPEGTRNKTDKIGRLKSGAFVVAMEAGASMVPCRIWYKAGRPRLFSRVTVVFGAPLTMQQLGLDGAYSPAVLRQAKVVYTQHLTELFEHNKEAL